MMLLDRKFVTLAGVIGCLFIVASTVLAQPRPTSPYRRMDRKAMSLALQKMQMGVLLEALADETGDNALKVEALMVQAKTAGEQDRDKLLATAAELVEQEIKRLGGIIRNSKVQEGDEFDNAVINYYQARLLYINIFVPNRARPYIERLTYLLGGDEDHKILRELTGAAASRVKKMKIALERILADSRDPQKIMRQVYLVPELENIQKRLDYWSAFIRYYDAISRPMYIPQQGKTSLKSNRSRITLLLKAKKTISRFASDPELQDIYPTAKLLEGQCNRELENFDQAAKLFDWVAGPESREGFFVESSFTAVRNIIEWGAFLIRDGKIAAGGQKMEQAQARLNSFLDKALAKRLQTPLGIDVKKMMLQYYLHQQWGDALRTAKKGDLAAAQYKKVQKVFKKFLEKYKAPAIRAAVGKLFRKKFQSTTDLTKLDPSVVLLLGDIELADAKKLQGQNDPSQLSVDVRKRIAAQCYKAQKMYQRIIALKNSSPSVATLIPDALWGMGEVYVLKLDNFKAVEMFQKIVRQYSNHPRAYLAAINAVKINNELINLLEQDGQAVPRKHRLEYAESLRVMLINWGDRPEAAQYHFDLAYTCGKLAEGAESDEKFRALLNEAMSNYNLVPAETELSQWATAEALHLQFKLLMSNSKPNKALARDLIDKLNRYGASLHESWQETTDEEKKIDLSNWGSQCEFNAQIIATQSLGSRDAALSAIEKLPARWPAAAVLQDARQYAIRQRLKRGDIDIAIQQLNAFEKEYGFAKAEDLMELVISKIRKTISQRRMYRKREDKLEQFKQAYLKFAETIFKNQIASAAGVQKNQITAMLADALVQSGTSANASRALELYAELKKDDLASQKIQQKKITSLIAQKLELIRNARQNIASAKALNLQLHDTIKKLKMQNWRSSSLSAVKYAMRRLDRKKGKNPEKINANSQANLQTLFGAITRAYQALGNAVKSNLGVDAKIILGTARCYKTLNQYSKALAEYRKLAAGLTPQTSPSMYWEAQLELCECIFNAYKDSPQEMIRLQVLIGQLREIDGNMGGREYIGRFGKIEANAKKITGE